MASEDRDLMEKVAAKAARERDLALGQIERQYERRVAYAKEAYEAHLRDAAAWRATARRVAFERMEVAQEATANFIQNKNDRARIKPFGLALPLLHPSNDVLRSAQASLRQRAD